MTYFVAGHNGNIAKTEDPALGWDVTMLGTSAVRAVVVTDDRVYAGCADGKVYYSLSGSSWELAHEFDHQVVRAAYLPWSGDTLFALTDGWIGGARQGYGWYEWQEWTQPNSGIYGVAGLLEGETPATLEEIRMVIAGNGGRLATADGWYASPGWMQWTERTTPFNGTPILAVARGDGMWVCGGGEGKLAYSSDGINWTLTDSAFDGSCIYHIAFDNVLGWLAVGAEGKVSKSLDGVYWDAVDMASESDCTVDYSGRRVDHRWLSATAAGGCWMVAGDGNIVATLCECPDCYGYGGGEAQLVVLMIKDPSSAQPQQVYDPSTGDHITVSAGSFLNRAYRVAVIPPGGGYAPASAISNVTMTGDLGRVATASTTGVTEVVHMGQTVQAIGYLYIGNYYYTGFSITINASYLGVPLAPISVGVTIA